MKPQLDKIRAEAAFDEKLARDLSAYYSSGILVSRKYTLSIELALQKGYCDGREKENRNLNAIIEKLIRVIERQDAALGKYANVKNWKTSRLVSGGTCEEWINTDEKEWFATDIARTAQAEARAILSGEGK